jgi:outer membrane lipoprotein-sorting protein
MASTRQTVHRNWLFLLGILLLLFPSLYAKAEPPSAEELFQKLLKSTQTVSFKGKFTLVSQIPGESPVREATVIRKAPDKQRIEFVRPREVQGTGMVMSGRKRWRISRDEGRRRRPLPPMQPDRMGQFLVRNAQLLLRFYNVRVLDGGLVAGRDTYLIEVEPKLAGRPSRKVWMDKETGVILKMENYDSQKRLQLLLAFSEIDFEPEIDDKLFQPQRRPPKPPEPQERDRGELWNYEQGKLDLGKIRKEVELDVIIPDQPPEGFILQSVQAVRFGRRRNVHLRYTDGLSVLSVFQSLSDERGPGGKREDRPPDRPPWRDGKLEKMNIDGKDVEVISGGPMLIFRWSNDGIYLTLIGELGREEMAKIVGLFVKKGE